MIINVGSTNPVKVDAVREVLSEYDEFVDAKVNAIKVSSEVREQPRSLEEMILGATNRAKNAFSNCQYSVGIESGVAKVPYTITGYMDSCICAISYGRNKFALGQSPCSGVSFTSNPSHRKRRS